MSISLYAIVPKPVVPISVVASTPVNPITSAGVIAPTLAVDDTPVKGTPISIFIEPTEAYTIAGVVTPSVPIIIICASVTSTLPTLGVAAVADGTDLVPYTSLYQAVYTDPNAAVSHIIQTGGAMSFEDLNNALGLVEDSSKFDAANTVWMAHPKMLKEIRGMVKGNSDLVLPDPLAGTPGSLFGYPLVVSYGAAKSTVATDTPTGNPLLIVGNRQMLINGVRGGVESVVSRDAEFARDGVVLKTRIRRGFAVADAGAFAIVEKTA